MIWPEERFPIYNGLQLPSSPKREWKQKSNAQRKRESDALDAELARKQRADDVSPDKRPKLWMVLNDETKAEFIEDFRRLGRGVERAYCRVRNLFWADGKIAQTDIQYYFYIRSETGSQSVVLHETAFGPELPARSGETTYTYRELRALQTKNRKSGNGGNGVEW